MTGSIILLPQSAMILTIHHSGDFHCRFILIFKNVNQFALDSTGCWQKPPTESLTFIKENGADLLI